MYVNKSEDSLHCLNGLRVLAQCHLIFAHRPLTLITNTHYARPAFKYFVTLLYTVVVEGSYATVNIFFIVSGLLATYNFFKSRQQNKKFSYVDTVINRFCRLTPLLAFQVLLASTLIIHVSNGPLWKSRIGKYEESCRKNWAYTIFYVNNFIPRNETCLEESWFLTADFQLQVLLPFFLLVLHKRFVFGLLLLLVAFLSSNAVATVGDYLNEVPASCTGRKLCNGEKMDQYFSSYRQTYYSACSFIIGVLLGYLLFKVKKEKLNINLTRVCMWLGWITSAALIVLYANFSMTFKNEHYEYTLWVETTFRLYSKIACGLVASWIILACSLGHGGVVNKFLSCRAMVPLSRLCYAAYLTNVTLFRFQIFRSRTPFDYEAGELIYMYFADLLITFTISAALYLIVEAPFSNILNYFRSPKKTGAIKKNTVVNFNP